MSSFSNILSDKRIIASFFLIIMFSVFVEDMVGYNHVLDNFQTEVTDTDSEKKSEKKESEKKEKETESEDFLVSSLHKGSADFIRMNSLYKNFKATWCNPEREIITPPPELIG